MKWFQEELYPGFSQHIAVTDYLLERQTQFQKVQIFETPVFGRVLALDNAIQITERDNHIYHEMLVHVPMFAHGGVKDVLIVGGGDGGCLHEALKHPVDSVTMVEIDGEIIELARQFFPEVSNGAFLDDRADIVIDDAYRYLAGEKRRFDLILIDSTDAVGAAEKLFTQEFYQECFLRLRDSGMIVFQSGSPPFRSEWSKADVRPFMSVFGQCQNYVAPVPSYPMGMITLMGASVAGDTLSPCIETIRARVGKHAITTKYYEPGTHRAAFELLPGDGAMVTAGQQVSLL